MAAQTNLAVDKVLADKIRAITRESGATTYEVTNQLILFALDHGKIAVKVRDVTFEPVDMLARAAAKAGPEGLTTTPKKRTRKPKPKPKS